MADFRLEDTIAAIATPIGEGGIAVIRLSGPQALAIIAKVFRPKRKQAIESMVSYTVHYGEIRDPEGKAADQVLVSFFKAPHSYTGEDVVEISTHGGLAVTRRVLNILIQANARHAEPGEFTKRAFLNGRMDLTQAEAVLDLIKAKSQRSLDMAVRQLAGGLSQRLKALKEELMSLYAHLEASIDFPEEDLDVFSNPAIGQKLEGIQYQINKLLASFTRAVLLREGVVIVIVGKPNVGKSSLFNALLERDRALVSPFPGTTRDRLEESLEIEGVYVRIIDTAGLLPAVEHPLERMSMERTRQALREAQLYLYMVDGSCPLEDADRMIFEELDPRKPVLVLVNKSDLAVKLDRQALENMTHEKEHHCLSSKTRAGLEELEKNILAAVLGEDLDTESEQITRLRHKNALEIASDAVARAHLSFSAKASLELVTLDLKAALDALKELVGEVYSEDLLDVIFSEFCIGK
ncbi:MAG: tRNA uridine-5-carboxymethylaminomethyl(34) synthesis GTPase MnmE [Candidatus Omnitrophica bacterium]|nr:tRNA uridine-5-carboxymethylaminomethyl(34) synthesis GTPase MnmE [Candidatus Omnitrophota bacterium]MDD5670883.1 tRNA uridine-5-carboxymethylaminomethyl(34) synthesis GTPase MnmE [Candidatus Omnitrophota bacterium]